MMTTRELYRTINFIMNDCDIAEMPREKRLKIAESFKREVRQRNKHSEEDVIHFGGKNYGDSFYSKEFFDQPFTEEEKEEYIDSNWIRINSPLDCTGLKFTNAIYIFNFKEPNGIGARSVVYHWYGLDV